MDYETVIGLEVHAQLKTKSKIFCSCSTNFGAEANSQVCPICLGMPGVLPVLNKKVVEYAVQMGCATNCQIANHSIFARKNYFYPDSPKGYQISQFENPVCENGFVEIELHGKKKQVGLTRIHLEEDAGKSIHAEDWIPGNETMVDLNRCGTPLIEIVSEPDMRSPKEAALFLAELKRILEYLDISDCNMEEGSLRCDANISLRLKGESELGTKTELKNMNSFKNVEKALEFEVNRQQQLLENGEKVIQQTLLWNADKNIASPMRSKEEADDYRYFPEPDLVPLDIAPDWINQLKMDVPELPLQKKERFITQYKIPEYDADVLIADLKIANFFEETVKYFNNAKSVSNFIMGEVLRYLGEEKTAMESTELTQKNLADLLLLVENGTINLKVAKQIFPEVIKVGTSPEEIVKKLELGQVSDESELQKIVLEIIQSNPNEVEKYLAGNEKLIGFFVGQIMRATRGKGNPKVVNQLLKDELNKLKK
jgi:aspartyl-tRNA(Asn)/glutamyl-tRNA(Gln) amidotransferase subunit B